MVEVDTNRQHVTITHHSYPGLVLEIDADGPEDDDHYEGITLIRDGLRHEGRLYGHTVSFLSPDHDAGRTERLTVQALDHHLRVRFEGGSYRKLSAAGPDAPVPFDVALFFDASHRLNAVLRGLFYVFPNADGARVFVTSRGQEITREFHSGTHKGYEYIEQVVKVEVEDPRYGMFRLEGYIERLQLHAHGSVNSDVFELDLDHSYKDRGQAEALLRFLLATPFGPASVRDKTKP